MAKKLSPGKKAAATRKRRATAKKAAKTRKRRRTAKKAVETKRWKRVNELAESALAAIEAGDLESAKQKLRGITDASQH